MGRWVGRRWVGGCVNVFLVCHASVVVCVGVQCVGATAGAACLFGDASHAICEPSRHYVGACVVDVGIEPYCDGEAGDPTYVNPCLLDNWCYGVDRTVGDADTDTCSYQDGNDPGSCKLRTRPGLYYFCVGTVAVGGECDCPPAGIVA